MELRDDELTVQRNGRKQTTELVAYDPEFNKPLYMMTPQEKKVWRYANRKLFVGAGYGFATVGGGTFLGGVELLKGAHLIHAAVMIAGFEIITTGVFIVAAALVALGSLLPWEES